MKFSLMVLAITLSTAALTQPLSPSVAELARSPEGFDRKPVEVTGILKNAGSSYFKGARFEIQDGKNAFA